MIFTKSNFYEKHILECFFLLPQKIFTILKNKGTTIIFPSHNVSLITNISDKILILTQKKYELFR
ncbi:MAG: hypothetical protein CR986_02500 [Ignavibacteriae bacterium]|nr:MAG: hypothetical protein CR986_02500 [Ignavibacteriota bacterium]